MKSTPFKPRAKALSGILRTAKLPSVKLMSAAKPKIRKTLKSNQRAVTKDERALWDRMAGEVGCIACRIDGNVNPFVSIHHIDGRTKPECHAKVLPLCAGHHQDGTGNDKSMIAVHPFKARFEARYAPQMELLALVMERIGK